MSLVSKFKRAYKRKKEAALSAIILFILNRLTHETRAAVVGGVLRSSTPMVQFKALVSIKQTALKKLLRAASDQARGVCS